MPELPEVETVRRGLEPVLVGRKVTQVETRRANLRFPLPERFAKRVEGAKILSLERRAKYLLAELSSGEDLLMHLGMTGRFTIVKNGVSVTPGDYAAETSGDAKHDHVVLHLTGGTRIVYNDPRRFGFILMLPHQERDTHALLNGLGVEPLDDAFSAGYLAARAAGRRVNLKALLMDQRTIAGLGNIYASEALFQARLLPSRMAPTLSDRNGKPNDRAVRLVAAIKAVLVEAIAAGGSTLRDYRHADGQAGSFQERFFVYDREGEPCMRAGCGGTIHRRVDSGRATYYCPRCQK